MAITYTLMPNPKWYFADLTGLPLGAGYIAAYSSLDLTSQKNIFMDADGLEPWPRVAIPNTSKTGILIDENGTQGPFYFEFNSALPDDLYYLEVYDTDGVLQWTINDFDPSGGSGGSVVTSAVSLTNLVINNVFWRNTGPAAIGVAPTTFRILAPGTNAGLANNEANSAGTYTGGDIIFSKNNSSATDTVSFPLFTTGVVTLTGDETPLEYFNYSCSIAGAAETKKYVQFPITRSVTNLSGTSVSLSIWAQSSTSSNISLSWFQFFGDGVASASVITPITSISLVPGWNKYTFTAQTVPSVVGKTLGGCGNDALFLQVDMPLNATCSVDFVKPCVFFGNLVPTYEYQTYDMIDGAINSPRTGDIRTTINNVIPGWVFMNDGTIGSATSGGTARANKDTFPLYNLIWNSVPDAWAPVTGGRTAGAGGAITDFIANKPMALTKALGRVFAGTLNTEISQTINFTAPAVPTTQVGVASSVGFVPGAPINFTTTGALPTSTPQIVVNRTYYVLAQVDATHITVAETVGGAAINFTAAGANSSVHVTPFVLGQYQGEEKHVQTTAELASHDHASPAGNFLTSSGAFGYGAGGQTIGQNGNVTQTTGNSIPFNVVQPTTYMNIFIKL